WGTFCDWYLEFTKPLLQGDSDLKDEVRATTGWVLQQVLILLNPFMPFITEELNEKLLGSKEKLITTQWPDYNASDAAAAKEMDWLIRFISEIRSVRADMNVPAAAKIRLLVKGANAETQKRLGAYDEIIRRMARLESIEETKEAPKGSIQTI